MSCSDWRVVPMLDERYRLHRFKSTSHAAVVAAVLMGALFVYERNHNDVLRVDLLVILGAMAVTKFAAMLFYRIRN
jgi:hypothetical protein